MNLIIDIGNTSTKIFIFSESRVVNWLQTSNMTIKILNELFIKYPKITNCIVSSVKLGYESEIDFLKKKCQECIVMSHTTPLPIRNHYETPQSLGLDRLAAAVGAWYHKPDTNSLIIDAGTAITIDILTCKAEFLGGNISPGIQMRYRALHEFTGKLPLVENKEIDRLWGRNTTEAIRLGVQLGAEYELQAYIDTYKSLYESLTVFISGGDSFFFVKKLKNTIFAPNLVAEGLHEILLRNQQKKLNLF
jgi:type III pantothenate kinase